MSLIHSASVPGTPQYNTDSAVCDEEVKQLCRLYPEIASWQPALIAGAWHQWRTRHALLPAVPDEREEAFPLYLIGLIRNRMEEMNAWR